MCFSGTGTWRRGIEAGVAAKHEIETGGIDYGRAGLRMGDGLPLECR
jgi:hypothetical protein